MPNPQRIVVLESTGGMIVGNKISLLDINTVQKSWEVTVVSHIKVYQRREG